MAESCLNDDFDMNGSISTNLSDARYAHSLSILKQENVAKTRERHGRVCDHKLQFCHTKRANIIAQDLAIQCDYFEPNLLASYCYLAVTAVASYSYSYTAQ